MIKIQKFLIAGGNTTTLIGGIPYSLPLASKYLKNSEQVGFIKNQRLTMMGKELCLNSTIAFASTLSKKGKLQTSSLKESVYYTNQNEFTTIKIPINYTRRENLVFLQGIAYLISNDKIPQLKTFLKRLCTKYHYLAFGKIEYVGNKIQPFVYVKTTDSLVKETACGSGSLAFSIITGNKNVIQPTQELIQIKKDSSAYYLTAKVIKIK